MKLFGQLIRTVVNVATLPVAVVTDAVTFPARVMDDKGSATLEHLEKLKREAEED